MPGRRLRAYSFRRGTTKSTVCSQQKATWNIADQSCQRDSRPASEIGLARLPRLREVTQRIGVGTTTVVSHAVGRKYHDQALVLFNQSQVLALVTGALFLIGGLAMRTGYSSALSADAKTASLAGEYLLWFIPAMALQFALVAMGAALRAVGNFKPGMVVSTATVIINMILAPFLIFGWGTGHAFGVAGAAMSSLIAIVIGIVWLGAYFTPRDAYLRFVVSDWGPRLGLWKRMLAIGLPAGFEFGMGA